MVRPVLSIVRDAEIRYYEYRSRVLQPLKSVKAMTLPVFSSQAVFVALVLLHPDGPHGKHSRLRLKCDGTRAETRFRLSGDTDESIYIGEGVSSVEYWQPMCAHQR